jgi:SAM-dependent methyltransferase
MEVRRVPSEDRKAHWEQVYAGKAPTEVSWFEPRATDSLEMILSIGVDPHKTRLVDAGGGASVLVDNLLDGGFQNVTVIDISSAALHFSQERLGPDRSSRVNWIESDITEFHPAAKNCYDIWHDRAVFHFLTSRADRARYVDVVNRSLAPDGHAIIATFALDGPAKCSGLDVVRYSAESLLIEFGDGWQVQSSRSITHHTPWQTEQKFTYCVLRRTSRPE